MLQSRLQPNLQSHSPSRLHDVLVSMLQLERRFEPYWRPLLDPYTREPLSALLQLAINLERRNEGLQLAQEQLIPGEEALMQSIVDGLRERMLRSYRPGKFERAENAKTHGLVRADVTIRDDLPQRFRHGVFATAKTYPAWVRFSGVGPASAHDIDDFGALSMSLKLMGVPGPKVLDDEKHTQDFLGVSTPTFITPDLTAHAELQAQVLRGTPLYYFSNLRHSHWRDFFMQSLWQTIQTSPLECGYYSCTPYLLGEGQAMQYSMRPRDNTRSRIPGLPLGKLPDNYLHDAMLKTLAKEEVELDLLLQLQTDPHLMPIENAAVRWPERLSPLVPAATIRIHRQKLDSAQQLAFASKLSFTPWHCLPEHRPLGNQNRARRRVYAELSRLRQEKNGTPHFEPTGDETFGVEDFIPTLLDRAANTVVDLIARAV